jgi:hypothetical protein
MSSLNQLTSINTQYPQINPWIGNLRADTLFATDLSANRVLATDLSANRIDVSYTITSPGLTVTNLSANRVLATDLSANKIDVSYTITSPGLTVTNLSATNANIIGSTPSKLLVTDVNSNIRSSSLAASDLITTAGGQLINGNLTVANQMICGSGNSNFSMSDINYFTNQTASQLMWTVTLDKQISTAYAASLARLSIIGEAQSAGLVYAEYVVILQSGAGTPSVVSVATNYASTTPPTLTIVPSTSGALRNVYYISVVPNAIGALTATVRMELLAGYGFNTGNIWSIV